jgi:hypothetical protein
LKRFSRIWVSLAAAVVLALAAGAIAIAAQPSGTATGGSAKADNATVQLSPDDVTVTQLSSPCTNSETGEIAGKYCFKVGLAPGIDPASVDKVQRWSIETDKICQMLGDQAQEVNTCRDPGVYEQEMQRMEDFQNEVGEPDSAGTK